jgi:hypothetical protein
MLIFKPDVKPKSCPIEDADLVAVFAYIRLKYKDKLIFHPVNEGNMPVQYRAKLKAKGMKNGIPDIILLSPGAKHSYGVIELKRANGVFSDLTKEQKENLEQAHGEGGFAAVAFGYDAAIAALVEYFS